MCYTPVIFIAIPISTHAAKATRLADIIQSYNLHVVAAVVVGAESLSEVMISRSLDLLDCKKKKLSRLRWE
jgi:hypothetical protein